jgi:hypothetical protein
LPEFTAALDFDGVSATGDDGKFSFDWEEAVGTLSLSGGAGSEFNAMLDTTTIGEFAATYELSFSDEDLAGALSTSLELIVMANVLPSQLDGDFNFDGTVDAADYAVWRNGLDVEYDWDDYLLWKANFGESNFLMGSGSSTTVPEPRTAMSLAVACCVLVFSSRRAVHLNGIIFPGAPVATCRSGIVFFRGDC